MITRRCLVSLLLVAGAMAPATALAEPFGVRLSYFADPRTSVSVSWNSSRAADDRVVYGTMAAGPLESRG